MSAQKALSYLREHGVSARLDGADVLLVGAEHLPAKAIARLREIKPQLLAELRNEVTAPEAHRCQCGAIGIIGEGWFPRSTEAARWFCGPCYRGRDR
ncbi:hypothetical protein AMST5_01961 [freshwater sediment metagenome]|uniref:TubC N-terminal docking domain-containing protein n=1 Tax=freshwater sediment metagenome TaxID=556182 RepID=A0AA48RAQ3_9ZZZZ